MKKLEIIALILMLYEYQPKPQEHNVYWQNPQTGEKRYPYWLMGYPSEYLYRKGYMDKHCRLIQKAKDLLAKNYYHIKQLEESTKDE